MRCPDVVVIGGGIIGTCCAYFLSLEGLKVHLVERGGLASGTSGACQFGIGHMNEGISRDLTIASGRLYERLAEQLPLDIEYAKVGNLYIADSPERMRALELTEQSHDGTGMRCELMSEEDLAEFEPSLTDNVFGGLFFPDDAQVQPMLATLGFARAAEEMGATIQTFTDVTGIELSSSRAVAAVNTTRGRIATRAVVNAGGAWSAAVGRMVGLDVPVTPRKGHIVVTEPLPRLLNSYWLDATYFEAVGEEEEALAVAMVIGQTRSGNMLLGSSREFVGFDRSVSPRAISRMAARCLRFLPCLNGVHAIRTYAGLRPYTPDLLPIIGEAEAVEGFYLATGHEGEGITMGPITGKLVSQLMTGQETDLPLEELSLSRFARSG